jgi:dipeptidyl aminopeptidase/acylaminoacyl peptidase
MTCFLRVAAACVAMLGTSAVARPFTLNDMLRVESLGGAYLSPDGRWLVVERTKRYDSAATYDDDVYQPMALDRLDVVDLAGRPVALPLLPGKDGDGLNPGPFSPDGQKMAVFRLQGHSWELGFATLATRQVRWLGLTVEPANWGRTVQWRSNDELVAIAMAHGDRPSRFDRVWATEERPPERWQRATEGKAPTDTEVGSGRFRAVTPLGARTSLVRVLVRTGAAQILAEGSFTDLEVAPTGRFVAVLGDEEAVQPRATDIVRTGTLPRRRVLTVVNLDAGTILRPCGSLEVSSHLLSWSRGLERLLVYARSDGADWSSGDLRAVQASAGACSRLTVPGARASVLYGLEGTPMVRAAWLGGDPVVYSQASGGADSGRRDWRRIMGDRAVVLTKALPAPPATLLATSRQGMLLGDADGVWSIDPQGRARKVSDSFKRPVISITPGSGDRLAYEPARGEGVWMSDGAAIAHVTRNGVAARRVLPAGALPLAVSDNAVASRVTDAHGVTSVVLQAAGAESQLLQLNAGYADISFSRVRAVPFVGPKGQSLMAWLYLPARLDPAERPPLIVVPYPGSVYPTAPKAYAPGAPYPQINPHILTAAGYAVLVPSMPRDWSDHEPAAGLADQVLAAVDAAAKVAPVDTDRMALWGHSFGGYAALAIATQTPRFKSVIEAAGKSDFISAYGIFIPGARVAPEDGLSTTLMMGWAENGQGNLGVSPSEDVARYARNSPALNADRITAPVLMIDGDMDFVTLSQGEEMFSALYRQDKDAVLMTLWGEGHTATSPANIRAMYERILWWLKETLPTAPPQKP